MADSFPRSLTYRERRLIEWVLPDTRPGYAAVRSRLDDMHVAACGRRGEGHLILTTPGESVDFDSPLPTVIAFGEFRGEFGRGSVTVREEVSGQIEVEFVDPGDDSAELRWTYSEWSPGLPCPQCSGVARIVGMKTDSGSSVTLAICQSDRRLWVHEERSGICRPVPVTLYYSELMRRTGVRDPSMALKSERLFEALDSFSDDDLAVAFVSYNHVRSKVADGDPLRAPDARKTFFQRLFSSRDRRS